MLRLSLCNHSDAYILVKGTIAIALVPPLAAEPKNNNKEVVFKIVARLTNCIGEINNIHMDNAK